MHLPRIFVGLLLCSAAACSSTSNDSERVGSSGGANGSSAATSGGTSSTAPSTSVGSSTGGASSGVTSSSVTSGSAAGGSGGASSAPAVTFIGRFDFTDPANPSFAWSASAIQAHFKGTEVSVTLNVTAIAYFDLLIDGKVQPSYLSPAMGSHSLALATGLTSGEHDVVLVRRDEAANGPVQFQGFDFGADGELLAPLPRPSRRVEFVGDSITAGFGNECPPYDDEAEGIRENAYLAWGPVTARGLDAEVHVEAKSGIAISAGNPTMPQIWPLTIPTDASSNWDFTQWIPDAIVINLGSNDWFFGGNPSVAYTAAYVSFLQQVRAVYPSTYILCALGPMLTDPGLSQERTALNAAIQTRNNAGDKNIGVIEFPVDNGSLGYGCAGHPSVAEDAVMASALETALKAQLSW